MPTQDAFFYPEIILDVSHHPLITPNVPLGNGLDHIWKYSSVIIWGYISFSLLVWKMMVAGILFLYIYIYIYIYIEQFN